ncbi:MAG: hypothetical protein EOL98_12085 [Negativicutes bacterium]|nr:hypothetical protein [Negativicutes bacterium]
MANEITIFEREFEDNLYQAFDPIKLFAKQDSVTPGAKTVNIPTAGALSYSNITATGHTYPRTVTTRSDAATTYNLTQIEINPLRIPTWTEFVTNTNLRQSIFNDVTGLLGQYAIRVILDGYWSTATGYEYATTGTKTYTNRHGDLVKNLTLSDVAAIARMLDLQKVPRDGERYLILDPEMYAGLVAEMAEASYIDTATVAFQSGIIPFVHGFKVLMQPEVCVATLGNAALRAVGAAGAATDCNVGFALHKNFVGFAVSEVNLFMQDNSPEYYGAVMSGAFYAGGKYRRANPVGCISVYEAAG